MYSQTKIESTLKQFATREGWRPTPHTPAEVDEFKAYIESVVEIESNSRNSYVSLKGTLSSERQKHIKRWIENEQVLCAVDSRYWESRYVSIRDEAGTVNKFSNRRSQQAIEALIAKMEQQGMPLEFLCGGGRRSGITTKMALLIFHRMLFVPNTSAIMGGSSAVESEMIERQLSTVYQMCPWWLVPPRLPKREFTNGSTHRFPSAAALGTGQGFTPQCTLVTGVERIINPAKVIEEGLIRAVQSSPNTILVLDGLLSGKSDWMQSMWDYSVDSYKKGMFRFCPVFIPWAVNSDLYPTSEWIKKFPIPRKWKPAKETVEHAQRCEAYIRSTPHLAAIMGEDWRMPREQKWFWEHGYVRSKAISSLTSYLVIMAPDDKFKAEPLPIPEDEVDMDEIFPDASSTQKKVFAAK